MSSSTKMSSDSNSEKKKLNPITFQTIADATLNSAFEASSSGQSFHYSKSVEAAFDGNSQVAPVAVSSYLQTVQRGGITQSYGCMILVELKSFRILAHSENIAQVLDISSQSASSSRSTGSVGLGTDVRSLFSASCVSILEKASQSIDVSVFNPVTVQCLLSDKHFFAILHRNDVGLVIDLEPMRPKETAFFSFGSIQSNKMATKAISRIQSLPGGDISLLCDTVVEEVRELTGYDRVMAYKFHEDQHGEVVAEIRRADLEPYLGLHFPATDIPQAARFIFMKNRSRMICNCKSTPVRVIQDPSITQPISLIGSTLRGVHGCHTQYMMSMGSIATLVMAILISDSKADATSSGIPQRSKKLWGLIVCHHTTPRYVPFPVRSACEFLLQVFGLHLNMELDSLGQMKEKRIMRTQTLLCDLLLRDAPMGIVSKHPNIMDLIKCDGAALLYENRCFILGESPSEEQIRDIAAWILENHKDSTGLSTDSLKHAGYPKADSLDNAVCGMAAARITSRDFVFWFRSHVEKQIQWAGARHDDADVDDGGKMNPRSSFKSFLEVVKQRSPPWEDVEMDAIHSLQLILRGSFQESEIDRNKQIVNTRLSDLQIEGMEELSTVAFEMVRLIETATVPIFAVDSFGVINGWNAKVAQITGLSANEATGKSLVTEIIHPNSKEAAKVIMGLGLTGHEEQNVEIQLRTWGTERVADRETVILIVNACSSRDASGNVVGVCFVGQDVTEEKVVRDKFTRIQGDYETIVQSRHSLIPPIFGSDEFGFCAEWNPAMAKLSGVNRDNAIGRILTGEIFGSMLRLKGQDVLTEFMVVLNKAIGGKDTEKFPFAFIDRQGKVVETLLTVSKRTGPGGSHSGVFCFLQIVSPELQQAMVVQRATEKVADQKAKEIAYLRQEIQHPLDGIQFSRSLLEKTELSERQKQILDTSGTCEVQLRRVLDDLDLASIEEGYLELETGEFLLSALMNCVLSQALIQANKKSVKLFCETPPQLKEVFLFGDQMRLQQVLADFLINTVHFTPDNGWVEIKVTAGFKKLPGGVTMAQLNVRVSHVGTGLPAELVEQMFNRAPPQSKSQEGLGLSLCRKLVQLMSGTVDYVRDAEAGKCAFVVKLELPLADRDDVASQM